MWARRLQWHRLITTTKLIENHVPLQQSYACLDLIGGRRVKIMIDALTSKSSGWRVLWVRLDWQRCYVCSGDLFRCLMRHFSIGVSLGLHFFWSLAISTILLVEHYLWQNDLSIIIIRLSFVQNWQTTLLFKSRSILDRICSLHASCWR